MSTAAPSLLTTIGGGKTPMGERGTIERTGSRPIAVDSLRQDLIRLGTRPVMTLLAHTSLSSLGWVCCGPVAVILALEQALGDTGTLVMSAHSGDLSDPAHWGPSS